MLSKCYVSKRNGTKGWFLKLNKDPWCGHALMMWQCTDGFHVSLPALIEPFIVMGCKRVDLSLQIISLVCTEEFL